MMWCGTGAVVEQGREARVSFDGLSRQQQGVGYVEQHVALADGRSGKQAPPTPRRGLCGELGGWVEPVTQCVVVCTI